ncbi:sensor histidine kinase [Thermotalea metallivorans]|nr:sensor histidine kinase [Thermotalea metallivorans]
MSLKKRITLAICAIIIIFLILLSCIIYTKSASILNQNAEMYMRSQLDRAQENIDLLIHINRLETEKLALDPKVKQFLNGEIRVDEINRYLTASMNEKNTNGNHYKDLFLLNPEGKIIATCMPKAMGLDLSSREYFQKSKQLKKTITSDILVAKSDGALIVITVTPIYNTKDQVMAYAGIAILAEFFSHFIKDLKLGNTGYYAIVDSNNLILSHPDKSLIATDAANTKFEIPRTLLAENAKNTANAVTKRILMNNKNLRELQIYKSMGSNRWTLIAILPEKELQERSFHLLSYVIGIGALMIIMAMGIGIYLSDKITVPIVAITEYMNRAAKGRFMIEKSISDSLKNFRKNSENIFNETAYWNIHSSDEIGNLNRSLKNLKEYFLFIIRQFEYESEQMIKASKELTSTIEDASYRTAKFISTLSHDLKTSITLIKGYAKGILSGIIQEEEVKRQFLEGIYNSAEDMERITCDILDSAYEAQYCPKLHREPVSSKDFAFKLFKKSRQYIVDSQRIFEGLCQCTEGILSIDSVKIERAWDNLLTNAVKYSTEGSKIQVHILEENHAIEFRITDEGIGIKPEEFDKIFNMFYRGEHQKNKGYGLGLFIAKSIIEAHKSTLKFKSVYGKGSSFWFSLEKDKSIL